MNGKELITKIEQLLDAGYEKNEILAIIVSQQDMKIEAKASLLSL